MSWTTSPYTPPAPTGAPGEPIAYASVAPRTNARVWAGAAIVMAGLALVVLGGCFLIGVLLINTNGFSIAGGPPALPPRSVVLMVVLYALALWSFGAAGFLMVTGVRGLYHVLRG